MDTQIDRFLNSKIKCSSCGEGPISFSIMYDSNNKLVTKYGDFCSSGCCMNFHNYPVKEKTELKHSRSNTSSNY